MNTDILNNWKLTHRDNRKSLMKSAMFDIGDTLVAADILDRDVILIKWQDRVWTRHTTAWVVEDTSW